MRENRLNDLPTPAGEHSGDSRDTDSVTSRSPSHTGARVAGEGTRLSQIRVKFLHDHQILRGKAAIVAALALDVRRGDEELASALRLKGEELYLHLFDHMQWEEQMLVPLLVELSHGMWNRTAFREEHEMQRLQLDDSLAKLRSESISRARLAEECLELVRWLEVDMSSEERIVLQSIGNLESAN